jgi:hypothetical protein
LGYSTQAVKLKRKSAPNGRENNRRRKVDMFSFSILGEGVEGSHKYFGGASITGAGDTQAKLEQDGLLVNYDQSAICPV